MGGKWVPGVSLIGLACVMCLPTPGIVGVAIGGSCLLAIAAWAVMFAIGFVLSTLASPFVGMVWPTRRPKRRRKDFHPGSGIARKRDRPELAAPAAGEAGDAERATRRASGQATWRATSQATSQAASQATAPSDRPTEIRRAPRRSRADAGPVRKMRTSEA